MLCKKDMYDLIKKTMGRTKNDGIQSVLLADGKTARDIIMNTADGSVKIRDNEEVGPSGDGKDQGIMTAVEHNSRRFLDEWKGMWVKVTEHGVNVSSFV